MNKHQTLIFIKYGKLISEINNEIKDSAIKSDMIKFLNIIPGTLKQLQPETLQFNSGIKNKNKIRGILIFPISKELGTICVDFDGNNNFKIWRIFYPKWGTIIDWTSIDNIEYYVHKHPSFFNDILDHEKIINE